YDTANQLYVIVNHVPGYRCSGSHPGVLPDGLLSLNFDMWMQCSQFPVVVERADFQTFVLCEASGSFLDYSESLRQDLHKNFFKLFIAAFFKLIDLFV